MRWRSLSKPRCRFAKLVSDRHQCPTVADWPEAAAREQYSKRSFDSASRPRHSAQYNVLFVRRRSAPARRCILLGPSCEQEYRHALSAAAIAVRS